MFGYLVCIVFTKFNSNRQHCNCEPHLLSHGSVSAVVYWSYLVFLAVAYTVVRCTTADSGYSYGLSLTYGY